MNVPEIEAGLKDLRTAREAWGRGRTEFFSGYDWMLTRLVMEASANYMSPTHVAEILGVGIAVVRRKMRAVGLDPRAGRTALSKTASAAMLENSAIMGIDPSEMDLTSPLAYLPMGSKMKDEFIRSRVSRVTELEPDVHRLNYRDHGIACGHLAYSEAVLVTSDPDKITCTPCRAASVRV